MCHMMVVSCRKAFPHSLFCLGVLRVDHLLAIIGL
jgi:hypothetical protein